jgi:hypothetical protein
MSTPRADFCPSTHICFSWAWPRPCHPSRGCCPHLLGNGRLLLILFIPSSPCLGRIDLTRDFMSRCRTYYSRWNLQQHLDRGAIISANFSWKYNSSISPSGSTAYTEVYSMHIVYHAYAYISKTVHSGNAMAINRLSLYDDSPVFS